MMKSIDTVNQDSRPLRPLVKLAIWLTLSAAGWALIGLTVWAVLWLVAVW